MRQRCWPRFGRTVYRLRAVVSPVVVGGGTVVVVVRVRVRVTGGAGVVVVVVVVVVVGLGGVGVGVVLKMLLLELNDLAVVRRSSLEVVSSMRLALGIAVGRMRCRTAYGRELDLLRYRGISLKGLIP